MGTMTDAARERARAKKRIRCPACGAEPGDRCLDLRPSKAGRRTRHVHPARVEALRREDS